MNILFLTDLYPAYKGQSVKETSYSLHNFVRFWNSKNKILVLRPFLLQVRKRNTITEGEVIIDNVRIMKYPLFRIPKTEFYFNKLFMKYASKRIEFKPDIVIAHLGFNLFLGRLFAKKYNVPLVCGIPGSDIIRIQGRKYRDKYRVLLSDCQAIACRSNYIFNYINKVFTNIRKKYFLAYSGIEEEIICSKDSILNKVNNWKKNRNIKFITVALLQKLKNIDINIRVLAKLNHSINWKYTIIGDGEELENLRKLASFLKVQDRVSFLGQQNREEVLRELKHTDIFIMVSEPETFGLAYLEAMAMGNIVIGAKNNGIDGIIENSKNGFLCIPRNESELLDTIKAILFEKSIDEINKIAIFSYNTIKKLTFKIVAENYLNQLNNLVSSYK